jgi:N-methylhydantoinase A
MNQSFEQTNFNPVPPVVRISADIGGTFTDIVLDGPNGRQTYKLLTTPARPEEAVLDGMRVLLGAAGLTFGDIAVFIHGTTLATNAIIERRGARTALIATKGFRDVLEIGNEGRYDQYDLQIEKQIPLVPRALRFTISERTDVRGHVRLPLDTDAVHALAAVLKCEHVESVAIAFIHGYANPAHERLTATILEREIPGLFVTLASATCPEIREYERTSTTVANAYVQPLMAAYLSRMKDSLAALGFAGALYLVTSSGSLTSIETAKLYPVRLVESGPAGGAIFAARTARQLGEKNVLAFDMGGTTAKLCLINEGRPAPSRVFEVDRAARFMKGSGLPLRIPAIELVEIGAGGGSIASVDATQRVNVGPESAGSVPGPACYGLGGTAPAVTDANVVLGLIDPAAFAGGRVVLQPHLSREALEQHVGKKLELTPDMSAYAVYEVVCESMAAAARAHALERGVTLRRHALIASGGAAPLHAARLAEKIGVSRVVIPLNAGVGSAVGFLAAPVAFETVRSRHMSLDDFDPSVINDLMGEMRTEVRKAVENGVGDTPLNESRAAYVRYVGQGHEISVALPLRALLSTDASWFRSAFEIEYEAQFARCIPGAPIEVLTWSVLFTTETDGAEICLPPCEQMDYALPPCAHSDIFDGVTQTHVRIPLYRRAKLPMGARIAGPAIITEDETSTFVSPNFSAHIDAGGCIVMNLKTKEKRRV